MSGCTDYEAIKGLLVDLPMMSIKLWDNFAWNMTCESGACKLSVNYKLEPEAHEI